MCHTGDIEDTAFLFPVRELDFFFFYIQGYFSPIKEGKNDSIYHRTLNFEVLTMLHRCLCFFLTPLHRSELNLECNFCISSVPQGKLGP